MTQRSLETFTRTCLAKEFVTRSLFCPWCGHQTQAAARGCHHLNLSSSPLIITSSLPIRTPAISPCLCCTLLQQVSTFPLHFKGGTEAFICKKCLSVLQRSRLITTSTKVQLGALPSPRRLGQRVLILSAAARPRKASRGIFIQINFVRRHSCWWQSSPPRGMPLGRREAEGTARRALRGMAAAHDGHGAL